MEATAAETDWSAVFDTPAQFGFVLGVALGFVERFLFHFELVTLAIGFAVVGLAVVAFGERQWAAVGRALAAVGVVSIFALQTLVLVFG
jgi:hypothetical protein